MVVIKPVALVVLQLKDFDEVVQEAYAVEGSFVEGGEGFEQDMLAFVALGQKLRNSLLGRQGGLGLNNRVLSGGKFLCTRLRSYRVRRLLHTRVWRGH